MYAFPGSLSLAITHPQFYWYVDESLSPEHLSSSLLRSEIHFGAPLPSYYSLQDRADEQRSRFKNFVVQYADILAKQSTRSGENYCTFITVLAVEIGCFMSASVVPAR